jgi:hypothetical protein
MAAVPPRRSAWRVVVSTAVTVVVLVVVFFGIFPKVADYSQAWSSIQQMPTAYVVALVVATVVNLAVYVWPLQAAPPRLGYGPGFVVRQTSFAISNAVPAGGAVERELSTLGQGGSIPLCNVFADTYPDAEIILMGVEEPLTLMHAPNESVHPSEIANMALTEALFLQNYAAAREADGRRR